jgi:hypothetical protein
MTVNTHDEDAAIQELVVFLRNQNVFSTTERSVTTVTEEFNGNGVLKTFTVSKLNIKNVRSVTVGGVAKVFGTEYTVNYTTATITFTDAPASGTNNVDITFDYGTDAIFPEQARVDLQLVSYPRISVSTTAINIEDGATDGNINYTEYLFSFYIYAEGSSAVRGYFKKIKEAILLNKKNFYYLRYITPISATGIIKEPNRQDKVLTKVLECRAPWNEEIIQ